MTATEFKHIGKITKTFLGANEDTHGVFTATLTVDHGTVHGTGQVSHVGGYNLNSRDSAFGIHFVRELMKAAGAPSWEELMGTTIYVLREDDEWGRVIGIENLPTEPGGRFVFSTLADQYARRP